MWHYSIWYFRDMKYKSNWPLWFSQNVLNSYSSGSSRYATIMPADTNRDRWRNWCRHNGRFQLSVSRVNPSYELTGITHVTPFRKYGKHSTGPSTYGSWVRTYSKLFSCKFVLTVCSYRTQANEICTYGRKSRGSLPRVRRYGLPYLQTVEYGRWGRKKAAVAFGRRHIQISFLEWKIILFLITLHVCMYVCACVQYSQNVRVIIYIYIEATWSCTVVVFTICAFLFVLCFVSSGNNS